MHSLVVELPLDIERRLREEVAQSGQTPEELVRLVLRERFPSQAERNQRAIRRLRRWSEEDRAQPEPGPVPLPPACLCESPTLADPILLDSTPLSLLCHPNEGRAA